MTGLDKITSQIQEEAEASAKERIEAAQKEAEQILADAKAACEAMEKEASDKAAALKTVQDGRIHSAAEQKRKTALLKAKQEIIADVPSMELFGYNTDLRSMTGGAGEYSYEFARYEQAPSDVQEREIEARASKLDAAE
ncbi:MAG: hypothetical protein BHW44_05285 [Roseburia sp. 40_7]|nr:MAG: hypothetical protein BHW44_05285 [Roseburia sp. 40_7]